MKLALPETPIDRDQAKKVLAAHNGYENLASNQSVTDRVRSFMKDEVEVYGSKTQNLQRRWRVLTHLLRGNSVARTPTTDVHVPELYKRLETLVPRIEEAVMEKDPWFMLLPRQQMDRDDCETRAAFLEWQLDQMGWENHVQGAVRSMLIYQVAVAKVWWRHDFIQVPKREIETDPETGEETLVFSDPEWVESYHGPDMCIVDPFDFIIDTKATDPQKALYVGDYSEMTLGEIQGYVDDGLFDSAAVAKLKEREPKHASANEREWNKLARSVTEHNITPGSKNKHGPKVFKVLELWCKFDLYGDGREIECVFTIVDDEVVVRAQENPYHLKRRPYAVGRAAKEAWDFFNTGPLDLGVRVNQEIDRHRGNALRAHDLSSSPFCVTDDDSDFPDSLLDVRAGKVFRAAGKVSFSSFPDTLRSYPMIHAMLVDDVEEITGAPKLLMGGDGGDTATESVRRQTESNRRLRGYVRSFSGMSKALLEIMDAMNVQYLTKSKPFQVLGRRAKKLRSYLAIATPSIMTPGVTVRMMGLMDLQVYGSKATGLSNLMNLGMPIIQTNPDRFDAVAMVEEMAELMVGREFSERFVKPQQNEEDLIPQPEENLLIRSGVRLSVHDLDDDGIHIDQIDEVLEGGDFSDWPTDCQMELIRHREEHVRAIRRKEVQEQARQELAQRRQGMMPAEAGGTSGPAGSSPVAGGFSAAMTPGGETPGPGSAAQGSRGSRAPAGIAQQDNTP